MNFQEAVKSAFQKYADFSGRATRSEYWWFYLFCFLVYIALLTIDPSQTLFVLAFLGLFLPSLALGVRRLHDIDKSGWWLLINFIPFIGFIVLIVWFCTKGTAGTNRFG